MKRLNGILAFTLVALAAAASARADVDEDLFIKACLLSARGDCKQAYAEGGGGGGLPRGLSANTAVELAAGEKYLLSGRVDIFKNEPYLAIDLEDQPWLASTRRKANPFYRIKDDVATWKKLKGKRVLLIATAQGAIWSVPPDRYSYEILLVPEESPVIDSIKPRR